MLSIRSNSASLRAQRYLSDATRNLAASFNRLSSGLRINSARDDPSGLSVALSLQADERIYRSAVRNVNDGISLINISAGAIEQVTSIVIRIKELAEQSANGAYSDTQRQALDTEAQELVSEYNRILDSTEFNGRKLFDPEETIRIQHGFGVEESTELSPGLWLSNAVGEGETTPGAAEITEIKFNPVLWTNPGGFPTPGLAFRINSPTTSYFVWFNLNSFNTAPTVPGVAIQVNVVDSDSVTQRLQKAATAIQSGLNPFSASVDPVSPTMTITNNDTGEAADASDISMGTVLNSITVIQQGTDETTGEASASTQLTGVDVSTQSAARETLEVATDYLEKLSRAAGLLGASESRLDVIGRALTSRSLNFADATSRILDADVAEEAAQMIKQQILQQSAAAIVAQANAIPGLALELI